MIRINIRFSQLFLSLVASLVLLVGWRTVAGQDSARPPRSTAPKAVTAVSTALTYQGYLAESAGPVANQSCDFQFSLYDALAGGAQVGGTQATSTAVNDGTFKVELDFGAVFDGADRFLGIAVRCPAGSGGFETITPRQRLSATPYAQYAAAAHWSGLRGIPAGGTCFPKPRCANR